MRWWIQFRLSTLVALVSLVAVGFGWWKDRTQLVAQLKEKEPSLNAVLEALSFAESHKRQQWSVSDQVGAGTDTVELELSPLLRNPSGNIQSGTYNLRMPTPATSRQVISLLIDDSAKTRARAAEALALYGQAFYTESLYGDDQLHRDLMIREAVPWLLPLLDDGNAEVRGMTALALGQFATRDEVGPALVRAFKWETDGEAQLYLAWAIQRLFSPLIRPMRFPNCRLP